MALSDNMEITIMAIKAQQVQEVLDNGTDAQIEKLASKLNLSNQGGVRLVMRRIENHIAGLNAADDVEPAGDDIWDILKDDNPVRPAPRSSTPAAGSRSIQWDDEDDAPRDVRNPKGYVEKALNNILGDIETDSSKRGFRFPRWLSILIGFVLERVWEEARFVDEAALNKRLDEMERKHKQEMDKLITELNEALKAIAQQTPSPADDEVVENVTAGLFDWLNKPMGRKGK